jgi:hypothetical protein
MISCAAVTGVFSTFSLTVLPLSPASALSFITLFCSALVLSLAALPRTCGRCGARSPGPRFRVTFPGGARIQACPGCAAALQARAGRDGTCDHGVPFPCGLCDPR